MIDISEQEFMDYLERYANNEITMKDLIKELEADYRTLNNKIIGISVTNPELYYKIVTSHPYKQKSRTDIDFEALMIYIMKNGLMIQDAVDIFNISRRTIQRRVNEFKDTNPDLYKLFKIFIGKDKKILSDPEIQDKIAKLQYKDVVIGEINEERENYLIDIEKRFNTLVAAGMTHEQAAKDMGYTNNYIYKALNELYRIKIEKQIKNNQKSNEFKGRISDMTQYTKQTIDRQFLSDSKKVEKDEGR